MAEVKRVTMLSHESESTALHGARVGWVAGFEPVRGLLVDFQGNPHGPLPALSTVPLDTEALAQAVASQQRAVLLFEEGDARRPLLVGLVQPVSLPPLLNALLEPPVEPAHTAVTVDGQRVLIEGKDEIVLSCGKASITLCRNGRVIIRGIQLESSASGRNRIRGGAVEIN